MKRMRLLAMSMTLIGLAGCASTEDRYYVPSDGRSGDYYYAPEPNYDNGYDPSFYGGYCPWSAFGCWSPYGNGFGFSFGLSSGPWWGTPYFYAPPHSHHDHHRAPSQAAPWPDPSQDETSSRSPRSPGMRESAPTERPMRAPESSSRGRGRERRAGSPPAVE